MRNKIGIISLSILLGTAPAALPQPKATNDGNNVSSIFLSTGVRLEYVEKGEKSGTPVIFLHGITDSWHSFEKILPLLPEGLHAFALSQRGHGDSERPAEGYQPKDFAADVAAFVKQKNLGKIVVVGHSMGSMVAQQFALDYPQLVKGIVLIAADAYFGENAGIPEFYQEVLKLENTIDRKFMEDFQKATLANDIEPAYFETIVQEGMKVPGFVFKAAFTGLINVDLTPRLKEINAPAMIFWGENDSFCFAPDQYLLVKHIRHSKMLIYKNTGHALHWEQPQRFANDLSNFIEGIE